MTNEVYLGLIGGVAGRYWYGVGNWPTEGSPGGVRFDPKVVMDRELAHRDVVGFYHTHPNMAAWPSSIDFRAMHGWTLSFGKPLVCLIEGIEGIKAHWFIDDESEVYTSWVKRFGDIFIGRIPKKVQKEMEAKQWRIANSTTKRSTVAAI